MRKPDRNPLDSAAPTLFAAYPAASTIGIHVRRGDARLRLREMAEAEGTIRRQEQCNAQITDRIARQIAESQLRLQYLIEFGVSSAERETFRHVLEQVAQHGGLSLREAANLAHAQHAAGTEIAAAG
ncbi:MAG: hypothetical protein WED34_09465 [Planctomycetales bacterium]